MARSSTLEKEARRRLRRVTPETAGKVLSKDIYWTVPFLRLFLDRCEEIGIEEPHQALLMTTHAPELARRIGIGERPSEYSTVKAKTSHIVLALAMLGSMNKRSGAITEARGVYAHAFKILEGEAVSEHARADLLHRYGCLQSATDPAGALDTFNEAASIFMKIGHRNGLAVTLNARAAFYCRQNKWTLSAADLRRACLAADENTNAGRRTLYAAVVNLWFAIANGGMPLAEQSNILKSISALRSKLGHQRFSQTKAKMLWMEGLLYQNLSFTRQAERVLKRARDGFIKLVDPYAFVMVTIDLARVLLIDGDGDQYEQLQQNTIATLKEMTTPEVLEEALTQWRRMPHSEETLNQFKEQVEDLNGRQCLKSSNRFN